MGVIKDKNAQIPLALFSLDQLNRIGRNDEAFTLRLLKEFIKIAGKFSESMYSVITSGDLIKLKKMAHDNIPAYSIMGLNEMVELLSYIENNTHKENKIEHMIKFVELVYEKNNTIISVMRQYLKSAQKEKSYQTHTNPI